MALDCVLVGQEACIASPPQQRHHRLVEDEQRPAHLRDLLRRPPATSLPLLRQLPGHCILRIHRRGCQPRPPPRTTEDYFVYRVDPRRPSLDLLRQPYPDSFEDNEMAILSCSSNFVVAALKLVPHTTEPATFRLHLYRNGMWTSQLLSVEKPLRDKMFPIPDSARRRVYHRTTKVIVLGGDKGIVGWVDLWRGIILCNLLSSDPKLLDLPLPPPAEANLEENYLNRLPTFFRDITVNHAKDAIEYVGMEITSPREMFDAPRGADRGWVLNNECLPHYIVPGTWKATTYKMPIAPGSLHKWEKTGTLHVDDLQLPVGNERVMNLLLTTSDTNDLELTRPLGCLLVAYPTLSVDDDNDVVYLLSKSTYMGSMMGLVTVDMSSKTLKGVTLLDTKRYTGFMRTFVASGIGNHHNTSGTSCCHNLSVIAAPRVY
jgi:hypothetical protein